MSYDGRTAETGFNFKTGTTCYTKICILKTTPVTVSVVLCYFNYLRVYVATTDCYVSIFYFAFLFFSFCHSSSFSSRMSRNPSNFNFLLLCCERRGRARQSFPKKNFIFFSRNCRLAERRLVT